MSPTSPKTRGTTIREVAKLAGVSIATVSRVLNGKGHVSDGTRAAVERVARDHGYSAKRSARGLSSGRTGLVGLTMPRIHPAYFSEIVAGATDALYERHMRIVLCPTLDAHDLEVSLLNRRAYGTMDGGLLIVPDETPAELQTLITKGFQFVVVDPRERLDGQVPTVSAANLSGAYAVTSHLLGLGHRRIAAITGPRGMLATEQRLLGYHAALAAGGATSSPDQVIETQFDVVGGHRGAQQLFNLPDPPTAIFAFSDQIAVGVLQAALARGLEVPDDLSIAGFDDAPEAQLVTPPLTTVRQPRAEMGRMAVSLLTRLLENRRLEALHVELATQLVIRDSTAPPPDN